MVRLAAERFVLESETGVLALPAVLLHIKEAEAKRFCELSFFFLVNWFAEADLNGLLELSDGLAIGISQGKIQNDSAHSSWIGKRLSTVDRDKACLQLTS